MPRPRLLSTSIRTPWVSVRSLEVRAGLAVLVGRDVTGAPIAGLRRAPERAMPCPCALLAKSARLTMSNHDVLTLLITANFCCRQRQRDWFAGALVLRQLGRRNCRSRRKWGFFLRATMLN